VLIVLGYVITTVSNIPVFNVAEKVEASSGCPPLDGSVKGWPKDTTVYYNISAFTPDIQAKLQQAFQKWTAANNTNGSGVGFLPANSSHPAMLTVQAGAFQKNGISSAAGTTITTVNGEVTSATTNIDIFNFGGNFFDPGQEVFSPAC
jgi:hypothetical protein